jgi:hypothetical protein
LIWRFGEEFQGIGRDECLEYGFPGTLGISQHFEAFENGQKMRYVGV